MSEFEKGILEEDKKENINKDGIGFKAINFEGLALFRDTEFHEKLIFKYVTFKGHNHFKSTTLHKCLDLEYTNIQQEINFYGLDMRDTSTTSQETYRIIKHQFDKLGNKIEANKYHALELEQKKKKFKNYQDFLVFKFHDLSSQHSTNWFLTILWILVVGFVSTALVSPSLVIFPYILLVISIFQVCKKYMNSLILGIVALSIIGFYNNSLCLKDVVGNISLFTGIGKEKLTAWQSIVILFNKMFLGYLYYQFLLSVRKDTRK